MSNIQVVYGSSGGTSSGAQYEIQFSDGAGGFDSSVNLTTDASGNLFAGGIINSIVAVGEGRFTFGSDGLAHIRRNGNNYEFYIAGGNRYLMSTIGMSLRSDLALNWSSSITNPYIAADIGLARDSAGVLKVTDGGAGVGDLLFHKPLVNISATLLLDATNHIVNCTANTFTVDLPTAVGIQGKEYIIKNSGAGTITVDGNAAETIDGAATVALLQYESVTVVSDNANWIIV